MNYTFDKIEERDIDFIVMRAMAELPEFISIFLNKIGYRSGNLVSVEHSFTDNDLGETDITGIVLYENKKLGLLIENKIDAKAMPEQHLRYLLRGEKGKNEGKYDEYAVYLIAPQSYLDTNDEAQKYENQIPYEDILHFFIKFGRTYDAEIIRAAIAKKTQGYSVQEVPAITLFWKNLYQYCCKSERQIEMYAAEGPKGPRSTWPQFKIPLRGAVLYYKANQGVADLQFSGKLHDSFRLKTELAEFVENEMHWVDTGGSLSLRIKVKPMDFKKTFAEYSREVDLMLKAVEKLSALAIKLNDIGYVI